MPVFAGIILASATLERLAVNDGSLRGQLLVAARFLLFLNKVFQVGADWLGTA
jgi:hypothetical protein